MISAISRAAVSNRGQNRSNLDESGLTHGFPNRKQTHRAELDEIGRKIKLAIAAKHPTF